MMQSAPAASSRAKGEKSSEGARLLRTKRYSVPGLSRVGGFSFAPVLEKSSVTGNAVCKIRLPLASYKRIYNSPLLNGYKEVQRTFSACG